VQTRQDVRPLLPQRQAIPQFGSGKDCAGAVDLYAASALLCQPAEFMQAEVHFVGDIA
jgi:hypothetical protein